MFYKTRFIDAVLKERPDTADRGVIERVISYCMEFKAEMNHDFDETAKGIMYVLGTKVDPRDYLITVDTIASNIVTMNELAEFLYEYLTNPIEDWDGKYFSSYEVITGLADALKEIDPMGMDEFGWIVGNAKTMDIEFHHDIDFANIHKENLYIRIDINVEDVSVYRVH